MQKIFDCGYQEIKILTCEKLNGFVKILWDSKSTATKKIQSTPCVTIVHESVIALSSYPSIGDRYEYKVNEMVVDAESFNKVLEKLNTSWGV